MAQQCAAPSVVDPSDAAAEAAADAAAPEATLAAALDRAAFLVGHDVAAAADQAAQAADDAARLGAEGLRQRALLVLGDAAGRRGRTAQLGLAARTAIAWAGEHGDAFVLARGHRLLSTFHDGLGDAGTALEHALAAVELLPPDSPDWLVADHETRLGIAQQVLRAHDEARERFERLLVRADVTGDANLRLRTLNNLAFMELTAGDVDAAVRLSQELVAHSQACGIPLSAAAWDTVAQARMATGDHAGAEQLLLGALAGSAVTEASDVSLLHVSLAVCQRLLGRFTDAAASLDVAHDVAEERELGQALVEVVLERSTLAAALGDYRAAYELHREYHERQSAQLATDKDARARVLAAVFETAQARRDGARYRELAEHDHLTGLPNRRRVEEAVPALLHRAARRGEPVSLAIVDVDHFKRVNDEHSHQVGDAVLEQVARLLADAAPADGVAARLGGEEFVLVLPGHDRTAASALLVTVLAAVRGYDWVGRLGPAAVTVSAGVATTSPGCSTLPELLSAADRQLYAAKQAGRDRVRDRDWVPPGP